VHPLCYTCFLGPTRVHSPNDISICSATFAQLTAECLRARPDMFFPTKIVPSHGYLDSHLIHGSFSPPESTTQMASRSVQPFCTAHDSVVGHGRACPFPPNCPFPWGSETPSNSWFLGPTRLSIANGILIGSGIYAQLTADSPYILHNGSLPKKIAHSHGDLDPIQPLFLGPTRVHNPNSISIGTTFLQGSRYGVPILYNGPPLSP